MVSKKFFFVFVLLLVIPSVFAQEQTISSGVLPDQPFLYAIDTAMENMQVTFAFSTATKARIRAEQAREKSAEARALVEKNAKAEHIQTSLDATEQRLREADILGEQISDLARAKEITTLIQTAVTHHLSVLEGVKERVPEQAKESIQNAIDNANKASSVITIKQQELDTLRAQGSLITERPSISPEELPDISEQKTRKRIY